MKMTILIMALLAISITALQSSYIRLAAEGAILMDQNGTRGQVYCPKGWDSKPVPLSH